MTLPITNTSPFLEPLDYPNLIASEQAMVNALITAGQTYIEDEVCNRVFSAATYSEEPHDGKGFEYIFVSNPPLRSLTSIVIVSGESSETFEASKFLTKESTGQITWKSGEFFTSTLSLAGAYFPEGFQNIKINYDGGFSSVPTTIDMLIADFVIEMFDPGENAQGIEKEKLGDYFYAKGKEYFDKLSFSKKKMLARYRIRQI